jgi:hypothetical protein
MPGLAMPAWQSVGKSARARCDCQHSVRHWSRSWRTFPAEQTRSACVVSVLLMPLPDTGRCGMIPPRAVAAACSHRTRQSLMARIRHRYQCRQDHAAMTRTPPHPARPPRHDHVGKPHTNHRDGPHPLVAHAPARAIRSPCLANVFQRHSGVRCTTAGPLKNQPRHTQLTTSSPGPLPWGSSSPLRGAATRVHGTAVQRRRSSSPLRGAATPGPATRLLDFPGVLSAPKRNSNTGPAVLS